MKILKNSIKVNEKCLGDYLCIGNYVSQYECLVTILRFDKEDGWDNLIIHLDDEIIELEKYFISNHTYNIKTNTLLEFIDIDYTQKIPKVIIQTHESELCKDLYHENAVKSIKLLNPEYKYIFFNNVQRREFIRNNFDTDILEAYDILIAGAYKADLFRYCYLYKNGGCYFDYKTIAREPLRNIIKFDDETLICVDYDRKNTLHRFINCGAYLNSVIMTTPNNINLLKMINACVTNVLNKQDVFYSLITARGCMDILDLTGPTLFYKILKDEIPIQSLRFKHIIENNDETSYENFKIVDIDTRKLLFTKTYKTCNDENHYSKLWGRYELFYNNKVNFLNLSIYVYPHHFLDTFKFIIDGNKIYTERSDSYDQWGLNLKIKIIDTYTSEEEIINVGRERSAKIEKLRLKLPDNVYFTTEFKSSILSLTNENNVITITNDLVHMIDDIKRDVPNVKIILNETRANVDMNELKNNSEKVDFIILYIGTDSNYYCNDKNIRNIFISYYISKILEKKQFKNFKILNSQDFSYKSLISSENIDNYINISKKFLKPSTIDDTEFINFTSNYMSDNIIELYNKTLLKYDYILLKLNEIIYNSGEKLEGNIFYENDSFGNYTICPEFENKRYNMFYYSKYSYDIAEIGFNGGHSVFIYLISNPYSKIQLFDLGEHSYSRLCFDFLDREFPDRLSIIWGDSTKTLPEFKSHIKYDLIHIDGGHSRFVAESDFFNCKQFANRESLVIIDDTDCEPLLSLCEDFVNHNIIEKLSMKYETRCHILGKYLF
jgi:mannosyltransferase OCH1-like enzyme